MRQALPPPRRRREPILDRLDRAAGSINPLLILIAIILAILDVGCGAALEISRLYPAVFRMAPAASPASTLSRAAVARLPPS